MGSLPKHWPYRADPPQRFWGNYQIYLARGGGVSLERDLEGYARYGNVGDLARFFFFCLSFDSIKKEGIPGDIAELGVYKGNTAFLLASFARKLGRTAYFLDTFEGFCPSDLKGVDQHQAQQFTDTSLESVRSFVGLTNCRYIQGHFPETSAQLPADSVFALVHIDCDLYAPIKAALEYFYPRMAPGGFIVVHDYSSLAWAGAERATDEFFSDKPEALVPMPDGCGSAVIRKEREGGKRSNWLFRTVCTLFRKDWVSAGKNHLTHLLVEGWSGAEEWGVWGIGASHVLRVAVDELPATGQIILEAEVSVALVGRRRAQNVDVLVNGVFQKTWNFDEHQNHAVREVRLPARIMADPMYPTFLVEFRPADVVSLKTLDPASSDDRALGMALHRLRRRDE